MKQRSSERGSALMLVVIIVMILVGISFAYISVSFYNQRKANRDLYAAQAIYVAEAGADAWISKVNAVFDPANVNNLSLVKPALTTTPPTAKTAWMQANFGNQSGMNFAGGPMVAGGGFYTIPKASISVLDDAAPLSPLSEGNYISFQVTSKVMDVTKTIDVIVSRSAGGVYWNAIFAGNKSKSAYNLALQDGKDASGAAVHDSVKGNMYSGGDVAVTGAATIAADDLAKPGDKPSVTYNGSNTSTASGANYQQGNEANLTMSGWEAKAAANRSSVNRQDADGTKYIDVSYDLDTANGKSAIGTAADGSKATQIKSSSSRSADPSHLFRKNPNNQANTMSRTASYEYGKSAKNDYYMEDSFETSTNSGVSQVAINNDTTPQKLTVEQSGNNAVYFIDGNMRVSSEPSKSYILAPGAGVTNIQMTVVVKGNVALTDNILYPTWESKTDALAIIAIADPNYPNATGADFQSGTLPPGKAGVTIDQFITDYNTRANQAIKDGKNFQTFDTNRSNWTPSEFDRAAQEYNRSYGSGNVYFGDPGSGTVEHFEAFLYAENNFYATNLDSTTGSGGTQKVEIFGNMTAGDQVNIVRQTKTAGYIPLSVILDTKIKAGTVKPPALPATPGFGSGNWTVASWKVGQ